MTALFVVGMVACAIVIFWAVTCWAFGLKR